MHIDTAVFNFDTLKSICASDIDTFRYWHGKPTDNCEEQIVTLRGFSSNGSVVVSLREDGGKLYTYHPSDFLKRFKVATMCFDFNTALERFFDCNELPKSMCIVNMTWPSSKFIYVDGSGNFRLYEGGIRTIELLDKDRIWFNLGGDHTEKFWKSFLNDNGFPDDDHWAVLKKDSLKYFGDA